MGWVKPFVARELFAAGFVSCWSQLNSVHQDQLVRSLVIAFSSPNIPPEILATLLNLVPFYKPCHHFYLFAKRRMDFGNLLKRAELRIFFCLHEMLSEISLARSCLPTLVGWLKTFNH